jgi:uncharacterized protein (UPF0548 family)
MLALRKPSAKTLRSFLASQSNLAFTYSAVGATATIPPRGFVLDHTRIRLGEGAKFFAAAKSALERWNHFRLGWVETWPADPPIQKRQSVAVMARLFGVWLVNTCRIVYVVDELPPVKRFGFAYGTLPDHVESGEERFLVEWHAEDNSVW